MPNLLQRINYQPKYKPQNAPHPGHHMTCGQKTKLAMTDNADVLSPEEIRKIQSTNGSFCATEEWMTT